MLYLEELMLKFIFPVGEHSRYLPDTADSTFPVDGHYQIWQVSKQISPTSLYKI